jgi:hypothetical protein
MLLFTGSVLVSGLEQFPRERSKAVTPLQLIGFILVIGGVGGIVNGLITDNGFVMPKTVPAGEVTIWRPGIIGNVIVSAVAALVSYALYNSDAIGIRIGGPPPPPGTPPTVYSLTLPAIAGLLLVGIGGARVLTNEVDKRLLKATAQELAAKQGKAELKNQLGNAKPARALSLAKSS